MLLPLVAALALSSAPYHVVRSEPLSVNHENHPVALARVNGKGPFPFVVDTGAQASTLTDRLVRATGLPLAADVARVQGASGVADFKKYRVGRMGNALFELRDASLLSLGDDVTATYGIIGMDKFVGGRLEFDIEHGRLSYGPSGFGAAGFSAVKGTVGGNSFLTVPMTVGGIAVKAVVDSGAARSVGNLALFRALGLTPEDPRVTAGKPVRGATEHRPSAWRSTPESVALAGLMLRPQEMRFADVSVFKALSLADEPAVILGADYLTQPGAFAVDYPRAELQLRPRAGGGAGGT
jgi:predicted aspartyl protease